MLALTVLAFLLIDLVILVTYQAVEGSRGNLGSKRVPNGETFVVEVWYATSTVMSCKHVYLHNMSCIQ